MKHPWNTTPPDNEAPLRKKLPGFRDETKQRLIDWSWAQVDCRPWLFRQAFLYAQRGVPIGQLNEDFRASNLDATAALDLLCWQTGCESAEAIKALSAFDDTLKTFPKNKQTEMTV